MWQLLRVSETIRPASGTYDVNTCQRFRYAEGVPGANTRSRTTGAPTGRFAEEARAQAACRWVLTLLIFAWLAGLVVSSGWQSPAYGQDAGEIERLYREVVLLYQAGQFAQALAPAQRAVELSQRTYGPEHPNTAACLNSLALLYKSMGDYAQAEPLYQRASEIFERALGAEHPQTATSVDNLAVLYMSMGDYARAEPFCQRALKIRENVLGAEHLLTGFSLNTLATLFHSMGDDTRAEPFCQRALKIFEKVRGAEHPQTATIVNNLASLYRAMGDYARAEPLYQRALKIREKVLGAEHPDTAISLSNLAGLYESISGDYARAEPLYQRALKICEKVLGAEHPYTATLVNNLAVLYKSMGDYARAEPLYQRALKIREKVLGAEHPDTAIGIDNLALLKIDTTQLTAALALARQKAAANEHTLANILSFTTEAQRLAYQSTMNPYTLFATLGDAEGVANAILRQKGVVLDSLMEDRLIAETSRDLTERGRIAELYSLKQRLARLTNETPKDISEAGLKRRAGEREALQTKADALEMAMARRVAGLGRARRALSLTMAQVRAAIPPQGALVELLRYSHYLGKNKFEQRYGAVVFTAPSAGRSSVPGASTDGPSSTGKGVAWIPLGDARSIDDLVASYRRITRGQGRSVVVGRTSAEPTADAEVSKILRGLYDCAWAPIAKALPPGTRTVIISPDGQLNFVSFATLLGADDHFLGERLLVRYVAAGRDLLRDVPPATGNGMVLFGAPDFNVAVATTVPSSTFHADSAIAAHRGVTDRDIQNVSFAALPGTATECDGLQQLARTAGWTVTRYDGAGATEPALYALRAPRVLHLATHGFFLPELTAPGPPQSTITDIAGLQGPGLAPKGRIVNPMQRSGIALAGANATLQLWRRGQAPDPTTDGILTAEEAGALKLSGTWLVALSACDTASGEARSGEGVMGLRRGFVQAGAQHLLMTLWPVADAETARFMQDFYTAALRSNDTPTTLADVQRDWLVRLRRERGLRTALQLAGPFILSSQGKL